MEQNTEENLPRLTSSQIWRKEVAEHKKQMQELTNELKKKQSAKRTKSITGKKRSYEEGDKLVAEVYQFYNEKKRQAILPYWKRSNEGKTFNLNSCFGTFKLLNNEEYKKGHAIEQQHNVRINRYNWEKPPLDITYADFFDFMSGYFH